MSCNNSLPESNDPYKIEVLLIGQRTQGVSRQTPYDRTGPQKSLDIHTDYRKGGNFVGFHWATHESASGRSLEAIMVSGGEGGGAG